MNTKRLVIVESPKKQKTIAKYLGAGFELAATAGHFRDLPDDELGVDLETFQLSYEVSADKRALFNNIKAKAARAHEVLLATDADREGEAIAWHLSQTLRHKNIRRIRFSEITERALKAAVAAAGPLDQHLVDAQQARRVLDRLVGYQVSPLLSAFGKNHSAGRVQSATLHVVVVREQEREAFRSKSYWTLSSHYANGLVAKYASLSTAGELTETRLSSDAAAAAVVARAQGPHVVSNVEVKPIEKKPKPPFITSTLQQAASVQLRLKPDVTMELAQALFEGGHISYHRTDSVALSPEAVQMARTFIARDYPAALPEHPPQYKSKASAQEAHEAIRPTVLEPATPEGVTGNELALYGLIRSRFLACQCKPAVLEQTTIVIASGDTEWRARGAVVRFAGFQRYLPEDEDSAASPGEKAELVLPAVRRGERLELLRIDTERNETRPPPRFTEATLIREMERAGIGRPSTYSSSVKVLFARDYVASERQNVLPTGRGRLVDTLLVKAFGDLVHADYTAQMETRLDEVAAGKRRWRDELRAWYAPFAGQLAAAPALFSAELSAHPELKALAPDAPRATGKECPRCSAELLLRQGKKGAFLACSAFPKCSYAADPSAKPSALRCPTCERPMEELAGKFGAYARCSDRSCAGKRDLCPTAPAPCPICRGPMKDKGVFWGCARYPECKGTLDPKALAKATKAGKTCPKCQRLLVERKSARGKFWGCSGYPVCNFIEGRAA